jgi:hypothetical protein
MPRQNVVRVALCLETCCRRQYFPPRGFYTPGPHGPDSALPRRLPPPTPRLLLSPVPSLSHRIRGVEAITVVADTHPAWPRLPQPRPHRQVTTSPVLAGLRQTTQQSAAAAADDDDGGGVLVDPSEGNFGRERSPPPKNADRGGMRLAYADAGAQEAAVDAASAPLPVKVGVG